MSGKYGEVVIEGFMDGGRMRVKRVRNIELV